jgi:hypothetical protein
MTAGLRVDALQSALEYRLYYWKLYKQIYMPLTRSHGSIFPFFGDYSVNSAYGVVS